MGPKPAEPCESPPFDGPFCFPIAAEISGATCHVFEVEVCCKLCVLMAGELQSIIRDMNLRASKPGEDSLAPPKHLFWWGAAGQIAHL